MNHHHPSERGQALVLIVFGFVVLLGFTALAIDGSMLYSDRRYIQNVADTAALAAASQAALSLENSHRNYSNWNCASSQVSTASTVARNVAIGRAASNDITIDADISDDHGVTVTCGVDTSVTPADKYLDITVRITADTNTSFAHFVYQGDMKNKVEAVARVRPREMGTAGGGELAILGLSPDPGCGGSSVTAKFHGNNLVKVTGGDVHSNGCMRFNGNPTVQVVDGGVYYVSARDGNAHSDPLEQQTTTTFDPNDFHLPVPDCASQPSRSVPSHGGALLPGRYQDMRFNGHDDYTMEPGLYCVIDELHWNGGSVVGNGVTIVVETGPLTVNGNFEAQVRAPAADADPGTVSPAVPGLLFYLPPTNSNTAKLNGNAVSYFEGVVLAPASLLMIEGTGSTTAYNAMFVGWEVDAGGTSDLFINYYPNTMFSVSNPTRLELYR